MAIIVSDDPVASHYNIIVDQGETFTRTFTWTDDNTNAAINLTGCTAVMKVRKLYPKTSLTSAHTGAVIISLTEASGITLGGTAGTIVPEISSATIKAATPDIYNYQLIVTMTDSTDVIIAEGTFEIRQGVV